jgi:hypothetical protein
LWLLAYSWVVIASAMVFLLFAGNYKERYDVRVVTKAINFTEKFLKTRHFFRVKELSHTGITGTS